MDRAVSLGKDLGSKKERDVAGDAGPRSARPSSASSLTASPSSWRVQYLGELPPETLGMSKAEALGIGTKRCDT